MEFAASKWRALRQYAEAMAARMDAVIHALIHNADHRTSALFSGNRALLNQVLRKLPSQETLSSEELRAQVYSVRWVHIRVTDLAPWAASG